MNVEEEKEKKTYENNVLKLFKNIAKNNNNSNRSQSLVNLILCPLCAAIPSYYKSYDTILSSMDPHVHFHCTSCPYQWMLCCLCSHNMQPKLLSKRDQDRSIKKVYSNLKTKMKKHTMEIHKNIDHEWFEVSSDDNLMSLSTEDTIVPSQNSTCESLIEMHQKYNKFSENLLQIFPDVDNDKERTKHNTHIRNLIYMKKTKNSYTQDLILDRWLSLNSDQYAISKRDCDLFLRIVRQIIINSRDEQSKIVDIYSRIDNRHIEEITLLKKQVEKLTKIIAKQKEDINELYEEFDMVNCDIDTDAGAISAVTSVYENENKILIDKLPIPLTTKDARRVTRSFVTGLVCPLVQKHEVDGYAYVLPSDILGIAITSGIKFEYLICEIYCQ